ncbi:MAG: shikimate dehydrogenase, partial [Acidimicrobiia bacterium]
MTHDPGGRTLRLVLLGDPVAHSRSPAIHRAALDALGIAGTYEARQVDAAEMSEAVDEIRRVDLDGANVTLPHKSMAARLADRLAPSALRAGSVNTLVREAEAVVGYSTDVDGLRRA